MAAAIKSTEELNDVLGRAQRLMTPEINRQMDKHVSQNSGRINESYDSYVEPTFNLPAGATPQMSKMGGNGSAGKNLPAAIRESMMKNPINVPSNGLVAAGGSVLDGILPQRQQAAPQPIMHMPMVTETVQQPQMLISGNGGGVDYGVIKSLIDESVNRHIKELKTTINENTKKDNKSLNIMKLGEKFQFLDSKGNLYEAQLKFVKNINKK
jgi:hypothetical protein